VNQLSPERIATLDAGLEVPDELDLQPLTRRIVYQRHGHLNAEPRLLLQQRLLIEAILATAPVEQRRAIWDYLRQRC